VIEVGSGLAVEENDLILNDVASGRNRAAFHNRERSLVFQPGHKVNALMRQLDKPLVIDIAAVHDYDRATFKPEPPGHLDVACFAVGDDCKRRQAAIMVQKKMKLDRALRPPKLGPIEK
jgi:hypothetical protein